MSHGQNALLTATVAVFFIALMALVYWRGR